MLRVNRALSMHVDPHVDRSVHAKEQAKSFLFGNISNSITSILHELQSALNK